MRFSRHTFYLGLALVCGAPHPSRAESIVEEATDICPSMGEAAFRSRLWKSGDLHSYDEYIASRASQETWEQIDEETLNNIASLENAATEVSQLLDAMEQDFPTESTVAMYNHLNQHDGLMIENPDGSKFAASFPEMTLEDFENRFSRFLNPELGLSKKEIQRAKKLEMLKLRYQIAALGVHLDHQAENQRNYRETYQATLDGAKARAEELKFLLTVKCLTPITAVSQSEP